MTRRLRALTCVRRRPVVCIVLSGFIFVLSSIPFDFFFWRLESSFGYISRQTISFDLEALADQQSVLGCLEHTPIYINDTKKSGSDPSKTILEQQSAITCGSLRRQWLNNPPLSEFGQSFQRQQSNCSIPTATHYLDNTFGLGSHFLLLGQALCNAQQDGYRIEQQLGNSSDDIHWIWLDQDHCHQHITQPLKSNQTASSFQLSSPMECYLPVTRWQCSSSTTLQDQSGNPNHGIADTEQQHGGIHVVNDPRDERHWCDLAKQDETKRPVRAAFTEYLFSQVSPLVIQEAQRQIGVIFQHVGGKVPESMVTVHMRWGDKFWEMDLPPVREYIEGVARVLSESNIENATKLDVNTTLAIPSEANIFLATEDPRAYAAFMDDKPPGWNVFADITLQEIDAFRPPKGNRASWASRNTKGRAGLVAMGSLLVAMEAEYFVLTTKSNWSTMMDHLRTNIIDPRCNQCTKMVDLRPYVW